MEADALLGAVAAHANSDPHRVDTDICVRNNVPDRPGAELGETGMLNHLKLDLRSVVAVLFLGICGAGGLSRLAAQGATATISGTVTDSSGAAIPEAAIQVKNIGTGAQQTTASDGQGRFRVPDLGVGDYEIQASKMGFSTVLHKGITLTVGNQAVVDFALAVGQQSQTVTVEAQASQLETSNGAVGSLTDQTQVHELPLNGRNFEQLILLAPGVQTYMAFNASALQGRGALYSVAGGRPAGQAILMDDENMQGFSNRGIGSITGSSLGVESIAEFQTLDEFLRRAVRRQWRGGQLGQQIGHQRLPRCGLRFLSQ